MGKLDSVWQAVRTLRRLSRRDQALDDYYTQLLADYERLGAPEIASSTAKFLEEVKELHNDDRLTWANAFALERMILTLLPDSDIAARAWHLRDRYRSVVSKDQYALYEKTHEQPSTGDALRKDMDSLLMALAEYYALRQGIELQRTEFSHRVQLMTGVLFLVLGLSHPATKSLIVRMQVGHAILAGIVGLGLFLAGWWTGRGSLKNSGVAVVVLTVAVSVVASTGSLPAPTPTEVSPRTSGVAACANDLPSFVTTLVMVVIAGLFGGAFSMLQRLQSPVIDGDQLSNLISLRTARREIFLAPIIGAVGALVLYCIFDAKLLEGELFPHMYPVPKLADGSQSFATYLCSAGPLAGVDQAKLLVWSFIAGFSERLLPDSLDRLTKQAAGNTVTK